MSCKELFSNVEELSEEQRLMVENGSCIDPKMATVENNKVYSEIVSRFAVKFSEELASNSLYMFYSYTVFDSEDPDMPIKINLKRLKLDRATHYDFLLILHTLELSDNIYSPFESTEKVSYLTIEELK